MEELDYMSDEFIKHCVSSENDVRPGLLKTHNEQRQHNLLKKRKLKKIGKKNKSIKVLQAEVLEESLKIPINSTNKGFSMLQKMGFKSGMGLGKNNTGIVEPIAINVKNDKVGLGHKKALKRKKSKTEKVKKKKSNKISKKEFRALMAKKNKEREIISDLKKSQRICEQLDLKYFTSSPKEPWFWPVDESGIYRPNFKVLDFTKDDFSDGEGWEISDALKLELLTKYLRERYFYCIWCEVQYNDEEDLEDCPGVTRGDH